MMEGRFFLGLGTGEALNSIFWETLAAGLRLNMLEEAVEIIRLWGKRGQLLGRVYTVENARIYTLPEAVPPIFVAASGETSTIAGVLK